MDNNNKTRPNNIINKEEIKNIDSNSPSDNLNKDTTTENNDNFENDGFINSNKTDEPINPNSTNFDNDGFIKEDNQRDTQFSNEGSDLKTESIKYKRDRKIKRVIEINTKEDVRLSGNQIQIVKKGIKTGPSCLSRIFGLFGILFVSLLLIGFLTILKYNSLFLPASEISSEIVVTIPTGSNVNEIGKILEENNAIKSAKAFEIVYKFKNKISKKPIILKAGEMILDPSFSISQTINALSKGTFKMYLFTVPEGKNIYEIAALVENAGFGTKEKFLSLVKDQTFINSLGLNVNSLEGYLFPDTYDFPKNTSQKDIITTMVKHFFKVWAKYENLAENSNFTRDEILTLASIVEKETGAIAERPMIAGVFLNRLKQGMRLQTDPTVVYGLENFSGRITKNDLQNPHPYNTYIIDGLPPGPIANPGEAAIIAILNPSTVSYLYFVSKNDGTHHFSETLKEHNQMVNKYQR